MTVATGLEGPVATVTVETVAVLDGKRVRHRFRQLRLAPTGGDAKTLRHIEHTLREAGAEDGDLRPKLCQALQMEAPRSVPPQGCGPATTARVGYKKATRMKTPIQLRNKLSVGQGFRMPELPGTPLPLRTFTSTYYDTPDLALLSTGVTMCRRVEDRREVWQLRTPAGATGEERARPTRSFRPPEVRTSDDRPRWIQEGDPHEDAHSTPE